MAPTMLRTPFGMIMAGITITMLVATLLSTESFAEEQSPIEKYWNQVNDQKGQIRPSESSDAKTPEPNMIKLYEEKDSNTVDDIEIKAVFSVREKSREYTSFSVFNQISGFDRNEVKFYLQGIVGVDKSLLYRAIDAEYDNGYRIGKDHQYSDFSVSIYLKQEDLPIRKFQYDDCTVDNYWISTLYDNDYSYNKASAFVVVDNIEIVCRGYQPYHYDYEKYFAEQGKDAMMDMNDNHMKPKTSRDYNLDG